MIVALFSKICAFRLARAAVLAASSGGGCPDIVATARTVVQAMCFTWTSPKVGAPVARRHAEAEPGLEPTAFVVEAGIICGRGIWQQSVSPTRRHRGAQLTLLHDTC